MSERIAPGVRAHLAAEIAAAGGREVSFVAQVDRDGVVTEARAVARGTVEMVLALPGVAQRGEMFLHNHPSGRLDPSGADLAVAARLHDGGVNFGILTNDATELYVVVEVPHDQPTVPLDPFDIVQSLERLVRSLWDMGFDTVRWLWRYFLLGAVIVIPIWLIMRLINAPRGR